MAITLSDILPLPGEILAELPYSLRNKIAGHHGCPEVLEGVTWKRFAEIDSDAMGKGGREIGVVYLGDKPAALCCCHGKYGDEWDIFIIDRAAYCELYLKMFAFSDKYVAVQPDEDLTDQLGLTYMSMLHQIGFVDRQPPPDRARNYNHLYHILHEQAFKEGMEVVAICHPSVPFWAKPADFALRVAATLKNVRFEMGEDKYGDMVKLIIDEEDACSSQTS